VNGFTFRDVHTSDIGVVWQSGDRTVLPSKRIVRYEVPGRDGYYESNISTYDNREVTGTLSFVGDDISYEGLRTKVREVAKWLSGKGNLIFDDEPDKAYTAQIIEGVSIEQAVKTGRSDISFDCVPFAMSIQYNQINEESKALPYTIAAEVDGTQETPCLIYVTAKTEIYGITITRNQEEK
jgi:predicted phage tail component-like protein